MNYDTLLLDVQLTSERMTAKERQEMIEIIAGKTHVEDAVKNAAYEHVEDKNEDIRFAIINPKTHSHLCNPNNNVMTILLTNVNLSGITLEPYHNEGLRRMKYNGNSIGFETQQQPKTQRGFTDVLQTAISEALHQGNADAKSSVKVKVSENASAIDVDTLVWNHKYLIRAGESRMSHMSDRQIDEKLKETLCPENDRSRYSKPLGLGK